MTPLNSSTGPLDPVERRRHSRSYVAGVALLSHPHHGDNDACLVRNLSTGGALLLSSPPLTAGESCRMVLTAPGLMGEEITARVRRAGATSDGTAWAAVEFLGMSEVQTLRLQRVISLELVCANAPAVLVVDGNSANLQEIAASFANHSRRSYLANSALTSVNWLNERGRHIAVALVGRDVLGTTTEALLKYIGDEFPLIHRAELDTVPTDGLLRSLLDKSEADPAPHAPWRLSEVE